MAGYFKIHFMAIGRTRTTWSKETAPKKPKGRKARKTVIRESVGAANWDNLHHYLKTEGAQKMIETLRQLNDREYVVAYVKLIEFIKPRLARIGHQVEDPAKNEVKSAIDISKLTEKEQLALYNAML